MSLPKILAVIVVLNILALVAYKLGVKLVHLTGDFARRMLAAGTCRCPLEDFKVPESVRFESRNREYSQDRICSEYHGLFTSNGRVPSSKPSPAGLPSEEEAGVTWKKICENIKSNEI